VTTVVKVGGRVQDDPALAAALVAAARQASGQLVIVHGGGDDISALQRRLGHEPTFVGGRRTTSSDELEIVRMVLSAKANKRLVAAVISAGGRAVGISGEDGSTLLARVAPGAPLGRVGADVQADAHLLADLLAARWIPIVSPVGRDADDANGAGLNVNGDDAAAAIAVALGAAELLFVADVAGVLVSGSVVPSLTHDAAKALIATGVAGGGMAAKIEAAHHALSHGVARVRISDLAALTDPTRGTVLLPLPVVAPWPQ
jgi:acetylglutamate kinase